VLLATAEILRHLVAVPFVLLGIAIARWPEAVAGFYAKVFWDLGFGGFRNAYSSRAGIRFVRLAGLAFVGVGLYWAIVGTG
jgi:hypothetical protein